MNAHRESLTETIERHARVRSALRSLEQAEVTALSECACRRCRIAVGAPTDSLCHSNANPVDSMCVPLVELVESRLREGSE